MSVEILLLSALAQRAGWRAYIRRAGPAATATTTDARNARPALVGDAFARRLQRFRLERRIRLPGIPIFLMLIEQQHPVLFFLAAPHQGSGDRDRDDERKANP